MSKTTPAVVGSTATTPIPPSGTGRSARRKQRCWIFRVDGITSDVTEVDLLASVRERYTTVKRLVVRPASNISNSSISSSSDQDVGNKSIDNNVLVEVQFTGPQPSEGPGALLCDLLGGSSVDAQPVELPRGRKKRPRTDAASSEASDSDVEDGGFRKMSGHRSTNSLELVGEEEEEESPGGGRCITARPVFNGQGGSPMYKRADEDPGTLRKTSGCDSGGAVATSSGPAPLSSVGLFKGLSSSGLSSSSSSKACAVVPADPRNLPSLPPPQQQRVVSLDDSPPQQLLQQQQEQHMLATQQPQQKQQQQFKANGSGSQWEEVVCRVSTPQTSSHSLDMGSVDFSSNSSQQLIKSEFEPLLVSPNSGGPWGSNESQSAIFDPMPPPQPVQPPLRGWSFDSTHIGDGGGEFGSGNMVMDLSDVDNLFRSTEGESSVAPVACSSASAGSGGSNADAGAGSQQQQEAPSGPQWVEDGGILAMENVVVEPTQKECDFEGRPTPSANTSGPPGPVVASPGNQCHLMFTGLENTGHDYRSLRVTAHFGIDSLHKVGKITSPVQIDANGRSYAAVFYPSMQEIWPELYTTGNIRMVEVDVVVEIRSDCGEYQYVGPQLKVTYLRTPSPVDLEEAAQRPLGRRTASRAPIPLVQEGPQVSYSCVDYSCSDWFSDMCHSVFRSSITQHQPLHDDANDLMNVDT